MTAFSQSPRLAKGAIIAIDPSTSVSKQIPFQYNPATLTRTVKPRLAQGQGDRNEAYRLQGPPEETIRVEVEIDAADLGEEAVANGIYPQLSALEMLVYPSSAKVSEDAGRLAAGSVEVVPPEGPYTVFTWGPRRMLPVRITNYSITEEAHDASLNPVRAKVSLDMQVLSYMDLPPEHPGHSLFMSHQVMRESLAARAGGAGGGGLSGGFDPL